MPSLRSRLDTKTLESLRDRLWDTASCLQMRRLALNGPTPPRHDGAPPSDTTHYDTAFCPGHSATLPRHQGACCRWHAVARALTLIERNRYGYCDACRRPLDVQRLLARPHVLCCAPCEEALRQAYASRTTGPAHHEASAVGPEFADGYGRARHAPMPAHAYRTVQMHDSTG